MANDTFKGLVFLSRLEMEKDSEAQSNIRGKEPRIWTLSRQDRWDERYTRAIFLLTESSHFFKLENLNPEWFGDMQWSQNKLADNTNSKSNFFYLSSVLFLKYW